MVCHLWSVLLLTVNVLGHPYLAEVANVPSHENPTKTLQNGIIDMALNLNKLMQQENMKNENVLLSPMNIYTALAILHLGSDGITRNELSDVMRVPRDLEKFQIHEILKTFQSSLRKSQETLITSMKVANGIFMQNGVSLKRNYRIDLSNYYNCEIFDVDFANNGGEAMDIINNYIAEKTENQIPWLYSKPPDSDTRMVLVSTLYLQSSWSKKFEKSETHNATFYSENGEVDVEMMHQLAETPYINLPALGAEACKLRFTDRVVSMFIIMPHENQTLNNLTDRVTRQDIENIVENTYTNIHVDLKLPKTTIKWSKNLIKELSGLGGKGVFTPEADFGNMIAQNNTLLSEIDHVAEINIDENGIEASAATSVKRAVRMATHCNTVVFHVNRPFLMLIHHHETNSVLFFGSIRNPKAN